MSFQFDCQRCDTRCDGVSKANYIFENDADYSERKEKLVIDSINNVEGFRAEKCDEPGYPDIIVYDGDTPFYIEIKAQRRTFMAVERLLPYSQLTPSETLALNLSDLVRYFEIRNKENCDVYIMWCLENRPCIVDEGETRYFYQHVNELERLYNIYKDNRRFRRRSGNGDWVNGQHKGVVVNYHFSLDELNEATEENCFIEILKDC